MPELAEVRHHAKRWEAGAGHPLVSVCARACSRVFRGCDVPALKRGLRGARLRRAHTHGKRMLFEFSGGRWLGLHLGMTGGLEVRPQPHAPGRHDHLVLHARTLALVFHDPRQFGAVTFHEGRRPPEVWCALPPQPTEDAFTLERVAGILRRHARQPLKALLLDQRHFPGIGNWMADEVMWQMRLPPQVGSGALSAAESRRLWRTVRRVCRVALRTIGVDGGDPPLSWLFRHRWERGNDCPRCGAKLVHETLRGRTACWCRVCQRH